MGQIKKEKEETARLENSINEEANHENKSPVK